MKYALLIYTKPGVWDTLSPEQQAADSKEYWALRDVPGVFDGAHLHPVEAATTVRVNGGQTLSTDGPFADTKEILAGYYLMEADDIEGPLAVAAKVPAARQGGSVEIRPIVAE